MLDNQIKPIWYNLRNLQGEFSGTQVFIFALTSKLDDAFTFIRKKILRHGFALLGNI